MFTKPYFSVSRVTWVTSVTLYVLSLTQQCYCVTGSCGDHWSGISLLAMGAIGGIMSIAGFTWYANPLLWAAWSQINKRPGKSLMFSFGASILSAAFLLATNVSDMQPGRTSYITDYREGYWLWLASMLTMLIGSAITWLLKKRTSARLK